MAGAYSNDFHSPGSVTANRIISVCNCMSRASSSVPIPVWGHIIMMFYIFFAHRRECEVPPRTVWCNNIILFDSFFFSRSHFYPYFGVVYSYASGPAPRIPRICLLSCRDVMLVHISIYYISLVGLNVGRWACSGRHTLVELWLLSAVDVLREGICGVFFGLLSISDPHPVDVCD